MLFNDCINVILSSVGLVKLAAVHLPKHISHYILFEACQAKNHGAVEAIVEAWPHPEITFDFMSNGLCRRQKQFRPECIEAHDYFNIFGSNEHTLCIPSIMLGVFNNIYTSQQTDCEPVLKRVDLSKIEVIEYSGRH